MRTTLGLPWLSCGARFPGPHLQATARALGCPFHLSWPHLLLVSATPACSSLGLPACGHREAARPPGPSLGQAFPPRGYNTSALGKGRWGEGTLPHPPAPSRTLLFNPTTASSWGTQKCSGSIPGVLE